MRKDNQLCEIEIREVDNEKKRIKIHYKVFAKIQMSGVTMVVYLTSKDISVRYSIHSTTLPVIFLLPCSHVFKPFAVLKSSF